MNAAGLLATLRLDSQAVTGRPHLRSLAVKAAVAPEHVALIAHRVGLPLRRHRLGTVLAVGLRLFARAVSGVDIDPRARIGPGLCIVHGVGIVVGPEAVIGERCTIYQGVTVGQHHGREPVIGNDVTLHPGCVVVGPVTVGDRAHVGVNAVVTKDVPSDHDAKGVPARMSPTRWPGP